MSRRPHWDDDLITAVMSALPEYAKWTLVADDVFRIIAAVEDWESEQPWGQWIARANRAEDAIEQVRRVCDKWAQQVHNPPLAMVNDLRRILDGGDGDE